VQNLCASLSRCEQTLSTCTVSALPSFLGLRWIANGPTACSTRSTVSQRTRLRSSTGRSVQWARMMSKPIEEILAPKPELRPLIYAYSIADRAHKGLLKVGQTTRDVKQRVAEQVKTAAIKNYRIEIEAS